MHITARMRVTGTGAPRTTPCTQTEFLQPSVVFGAGVAPNRASGYVACMATWDGHLHIEIEPPYLVVKPGLSEDDFYRLADEDCDWEYLDGRIVMHSPASYRHEALFCFLNFLLSGYVDQKGGATVLGSRYPMRLDPEWSPEPDLLVVRDSRRHLLTSRCLEGPADWVIEIASESDPRLDTREKLPRYRAADIEEIWLINPFAHEIHIAAKHAVEYTARTLAAGLGGLGYRPGLLDRRFVALAGAAALQSRVPQRRAPIDCVPPRAARTASQVTASDSSPRRKIIGFQRGAVDRNARPGRRRRRVSKVNWPSRRASGAPRQK